MRRLAWLGASILGLVFGWGVWSYRHSLVPPPKQGGGIRFELRGTEWVGYQPDGKVQWRIIAQSGGVNPGNPRVFVAKMVSDGEVYDAQGKQKLNHLQARILYIDTEAKTAMLVPKAKFHYAHHEIQCEGPLQMNLIRLELETSHNMTWKNASMLGQAQSLKVSLKENRCQFEGAVQLQRGNRQIQADKMDYEVEHDVLVFPKGIRWEAPDLTQLVSREHLQKLQKKDWIQTVHARTVITADYGKMTRDELIFEGQVLVSQPQQTLSCRQLSIRPKEGLVSAKDRVKWRKPNQLNGEAQRVTLNITQEKVEASQRIKTIFYQKRVEIHD